MKKLFSIAVLGLVASIGSFAAPCVSGSTVAELSSCAFGTITVSNGANSWTLSNFGADTVSSTGYAAGVNGSNASTYIAASWAPYTVGNQFGFAVTFSTAGATNLFTASSSGFDQQVAFNNFYTVTANDGASNIIQFGNFITGWSSNAVQGEVAPDVRVNKGILDNGNTIVNLQANQSLLFRNPVSIGGITQPDFSVVDGYQLASGSGSGAFGQITSYTNYFLPAAAAAEIPEPMTFVLMGVGLVGVAVLRRRK